MIARTARTPPRRFGDRVLLVGGDNHVGGMPPLMDLVTPPAKSMKG